MNAPKLGSDQYAPWLVKASALATSPSASSTYRISKATAGSPKYSLIPALGNMKSMLPWGFKAFRRRSPREPCRRSSPAGPIICACVPFQFNILPRTR